MFEREEVVRILTAAVMELLPPGERLRIPKSATSGAPEDEEFCIQVDARGRDHYSLQVSALTPKQRRSITGRTEAVLKSKVDLDGGWTIKVWHYRKTETGLEFTKWQAKRFSYKILAKGGYTEVEITSPDGGRTFSGTAVCSPQDSYCRAEGRVIALDRAVEKYEAECFPTMQQLIDGGYPDGFVAAAGAQS